MKISPDRGHPTHEGRFHPIGRGRLFAIGRFASSVTSVVAELFARDAPAITGDAFPALIGARRTSLHQRGSIAPAREHDARGNSGGFAPLETSCRRVAGVSRLYWCNSPRLLAPSTWGGLDRAPLMVQFPSPCPGMKGAAPKPQAPRRPRAPKPPPPRHNGGFCTIRSILSACRRRVTPLMLQIPPRLLAARPRFGAVRSQFAVVWRPHRRPPRRQTPTMGRAVPGVVGEVVCDAGTTTPGLARRSHTNPLLRVLACYFARKPAIPRLGAAAHARISGLACESEGPGAD